MTIKSSDIIWKIYYDDLSDEMITAWQSLCDSDDKCCASSYPVFAIKSQSLLPASKFIFALAFHSGNLISAIPLHIKLKKICFIDFRVLQTINHDHLDMYNIPCSNSVSVNIIVESLVSSIDDNIPSWDYFQIRNLRGYDNSYDKILMPDYVRKSAYLSLNNINDLMSLVSAKKIRNIKRLEKKLIFDVGAVRLELFKNPDDFISSFNDFCEIENSGWKGEEKTSIKSNNNNYYFYRDVWQSLFEKSNGIIYILYVDGLAIAGALGFCQSNNVYLHKISFSEVHSKYGPGSLMIKQILERALVSTEINSVYFNTSPEWIKRWHPKSLKLYALEKFNSNIQGLLLNIIFKSYRLARFCKVFIKNKLKNYDKL